MSYDEGNMDFGHKTDSPLHLSEAELDELTALHLPVPHQDGLTCYQDAEPWPCLAWRMTQEFDRLRADLTAAQEEIKERDRTYLAVQKAEGAERNKLAERLEKAEAALLDYGNPASQRLIVAIRTERKNRLLGKEDGNECM